MCPNIIFAAYFVLLTSGAYFEGFFCEGMKMTQNSIFQETIGFKNGNVQNSFMNLERKKLKEEENIRENVHIQKNVQNSLKMTQNHEIV